MSWRYEQATGRLITPTGKLMAIGYAGAGVGKNNPAAENIKDVGPLPRGFYRMNAPVDEAKQGLYVIWLTPEPGNYMFGRSGFGIHGDDLLDPGHGSDGCICMPRFARHACWENAYFGQPDHYLFVARNEDDATPSNVDSVRNAAADDNF